MKEYIAGWLLILGFAFLMAIVHVAQEDLLSTHKSQFLDQRRRIVPFPGDRPKARPDRKVSYEGEDIRVLGVIPWWGPSPAQIWLDEHLRPKNTPKLPLLQYRAQLRIFAGKQELTSTLFSNHDTLQPLVRVASPGDSLLWKVNADCHLEPRKYWGIVDAGAKSRAFSFQVLPVPDSLAHIWELFKRLDGVPPARYRPHETHAWQEEEQRQFNKDIEEFARFLVAYPLGTPLRMEGLRLCAQSFGALRDDSTLQRAVMREFAEEPRAEPRDMFYAFSEYCRHNFRSHNDEQFAYELGGRRLAEAVKQNRPR